MKKEIKNMKRFTKTLAVAACVAALGAGMGAFAGCGGETTISISGSTSVNEIMEVLADKYTESHSGVQININANGSGAGIEDTIEGRNEIGMASRNLKDSETEKGVEGKQLCIDGIVLAVSKNCTATKVTNEQIFNLVMNGTPFTDSEATISAVAGRDGSSGTREAFDEKVYDANDKSIKDLTGDKNNPNPPTYSSAVSINNSTGAVISKITSDANYKTDGYISMGSYHANTSTLKALSFQAKDQTEAVAPSVATVKDGTYRMQRPFVIVTKTGAELSDAAKAFYDWLWSDEAKELIESKGYVVK